jgi:hypothetical protein
MSLNGIVRRLCLVSKNRFPGNRAKSGKAAYSRSSGASFFSQAENEACGYPRGNGKKQRNPGHLPKNIPNSFHARTPFHKDLQKKFNTRR